MGLFGRRNRKNDRHEADVREFVGMRMEVMNAEEQLMFTAVTSINRKNRMVLCPLATVYLAPSISPYPVLLRGYEDIVEKAVYLKCSISEEQNGNWLMSDTEILVKHDEREYYRYHLSADGEFMKLRQRGIGVTPCQIVNISVGGVRISTEKALMTGEKLILCSPVFEGWALTPPMCRVKRIFFKKHGYTYDCEFVDLTPQTEDLIARALVKLQQISIRNSRLEE